MASTNKTANLNLNSWVASDPVLREDFNADNEKLDAAIAQNAASCEALSSQISSVESTLGAEIDAVNTALGAEIDALESSLSSEISALGSSVETDISALETGLAAADASVLDLSYDVYNLALHAYYSEGTGLPYQKAVDCIGFTGQDYDASVAYIDPETKSLWLGAATGLSSVTHALSLATATNAIGNTTGGYISSIFACNGRGTLNSFTAYIAANGSVTSPNCVLQFRVGDRGLSSTGTVSSYVSSSSVTITGLSSSNTAFTFTFSSGVQLLPGHYYDFQLYCQSASGNCMVALVPKDSVDSRFYAAFPAGTLNITASPYLLFSDTLTATPSDGYSEARFICRYSGTGTITPTLDGTSMTLAATRSTQSASGVSCTEKEWKLSLSSVKTGSATATFSASTIASANLKVFDCGLIVA